MKNKMYVLGFLTLMTISFTASAQVYKSFEDTANLNKEFTEVSNDIATLTAKLTVAQNNMSGYKDKSSTADDKAQVAAENSSVQADKAINGNVKDARKAKRDSKKAFRKAKDARSATKDIGDQDDKIASLTGELAKKQARLEQLTSMRTFINASLPAQQ